MEQTGSFQTLYKYYVCLALAPVWNAEKERVENGRIAFFQSLLIAASTYAYLIYGDVVEYSMTKAVSDIILYTLAKFSFMALIFQLLYNRYNKYWCKLLRFTQIAPSKRYNSYMMAHFITLNVYFVAIIVVQAYVWLSTPFLRQLYALQAPILFIMYMNSAHTSLIFNFLLIMNGDLKKINADIELRDSDANVTSHFRQIRIRYTNALKSSAYFNKLFGVTFICQTFYTMNFLLESLNFITLQTLRTVQVKEYIILFAMPVFPLASFAVISFGCDAIVETAKEIPRHCYKLLEEPVGSEVRMELYILASFAKSQVPEFTASGFFTINRSILYSLFVATTTYFVVALQLNEKILKIQ